MAVSYPPSGEALAELFERRIVLLDGAMGSMIQKLGLADDDYAGARFASHPIALKGCSDILCLTQPKAIEDIHYQYFRAGADIVETNSFTATSIALADYELTHLVRELNLAAAHVAVAARDRAMAEDGKRRWVAGAIG